MAISSEKIESKSQDTRLDIDLVTAENLMKRGFSEEEALAILGYANLLTGSKRPINTRFLKQVQKAKKTATQLGLDVRQETAELGESNTPLKIYYGPDWENPNYVPRGLRGEPNHRVISVEKTLVIQKNIEINCVINSN